MSLSDAQEIVFIWWFGVVPVFPKVHDGPVAFTAAKTVRGPSASSSPPNSSNFSYLLARREGCVAIRAYSVGVLRVGIMLFSSL